MSILSQLSHPELDRLLTANDYRAAKSLLVSLNRDQPEVLQALSADAVQHWLEQAEKACRTGDRGRMNSCLAAGARFRDSANAHLFRETRRTLRSITLEFTTAAHWIDLLRAATRQRTHYFLRQTEPIPSRYNTFANPRLLEEIGLDNIDLDGLDHIDLHTYIEPICASYPDALAKQIPSLGAPFLRAAIQIIGARPDLAILDLLELPDTHPVVCLERARVSYALGVPNTAVLALADFLQLHGEHVAIRRLHTGVFMSQMAHASGDVERAVDILQTLPRTGIGRRPILLLSRLLGEVGRSDEGREVLQDWCREHPSDKEAENLLNPKE